MFMRSRATAVDCLRRVINVLRSMDHTVRALRLDNDNVFLSQDFVAERERLGIRREYSAP